MSNDLIIAQAKKSVTVLWWGAEYKVDKLWLEALFTSFTYKLAG